MNRIKQDDYELLVAPITYIDPSIIPARVKTIIGPQLYVFPSGPTVGPYDSSFENRYVITCLSEWVGTMWHTCCSLRFPTVSLPTGVETNRFIPGNVHRDCFILYLKDRPFEDIRIVNEAVKSIPLPCVTFVYGSYNESDYFNALQRAQFMIVVGRHESQGYALQEAMSCNVPLLVWDVSSMYQEYVRNRQVYAPRGIPLLATAVPWWSDECGIRIWNGDDLPRAIERMMTEWSNFTPRNYVVQNLSDEACMRRWLKAVKLE